MTPRRIVRNGNRFDRRLVLAARAEAPAPAAEESVLVALGLRVNSPVESTGAESLLRGKVLKSLLAALAAACGAGGIVWSLAHPAAGPSGPVLVAPPLPAAAATAPASSSSATGEEVAVKSAPYGSSMKQPVQVRRQARRASPRAPESPVACDLSVEIALVQRAAQSLAADDAGAAVRELEAYRARCPRGVLTEEAGLLRARALVAQGRTSEATALARTLLDANPHGILAGPLRALIEAGTPR